MYKLINQKEADTIKEILLSTWLYKDIEIEVGEFKLNVFGISENDETQHHQPFDMKEFYLLGKNNEFEVLEYKEKKYDVFVNVGQWGYESRLKDTHITLGSSKFHDFCFQIELSQAIKDEDYIYIIKNVTNMAGAGAICRLYRGLKHNRMEKLRRQEVFIERFGKKILRYKNKDWIVISKIRLEDMYDEDKADYIFYDLINNMFFAMLLVEDISKKGI